MEKSTMNAANGLLFLFYPKSEEKQVRGLRKKLAENNIIAISCDDPNAFRFVKAQTIYAGSLDIIGQTALACVGVWQAESKFLKTIQDKLLKQEPKKEP